MFNSENKTENVSLIDTDYEYRENTIRTLLIIFAVLAIGILAVNYLNGSTQMVLISVFVIVFLIVSFILLEKDNIFVAQITIPTALFFIVLFSVISNQGLHDTSMFAFTIVISLANLTLGQRGTYTFAVLVILSILGLGIAELSEVLFSEASSLTTWTSISYAIALVITYSAIQGRLVYILNHDAKTSQENEKTQMIANKKLREKNRIFEDRIINNTQKLQKYAKQLTAIAEVANAIASIRDIEELLNLSTNLIHKNFDYRQVAIFLLAENEKRVVLRSASSDGEWQKMLDGGYALSIDSKSNIGLVAKNQTIYSSSETQPDIQPEIIVPIKVGSRLIGILYIQNNHKDNFSQDDIKIVTILSDHLAVAIENSRLMETRRSEMVETVQSFQRYVKQAWYQYTQRLDQNEYRYQNGEILSSKSQEPNPDSSNDLNRLSIPLYVRGQKIGALDIEPRNNLRRWTKDEIALVEAASERTALALETARLLEDSQRHASREKAIGELSTKISATTDTETIIQTAVMELGRQIGSAKVSIEINPELERDDF